MKNKFPYHLLLFFIPLFFIQCSENTSETKIEYKKKLKYFSDNYGVEHFFENGNNSGASIILPECFTKDYSSISITNKNNFNCFDNKVHFTIDIIDKKEINYYAEYFNDEKIKSQDNINIMRDYCVETRAAGLFNETRSIYSILTTKESKAILLGSVKGTSGKASKELIYQFGVLEGKENFYVLQAILSSDNSSFLYPDILEIFKTFKLN